MNMLQDFITKHESKFYGKGYTYEFTEYKSAKIKMKVTCPIHGVYEKQKNNHLTGKGCQKCVQEKMAKEIITKAKDKFFAFVEKKYNNYYIYHKDTYIDYHSNFKVDCPKHGLFEIKPANHARDSSCLDCKREARILAQEEAEYKLTLYADKSLEIKPFIYDGNTTMVPWKCLKCGFEDASRYNNLTNKKHPSKCSACSAFYTQEEIEDKIKNNVEYTLFIAPFKYIGTRETRVDVHCNKCGRDFNIYLWTIISDKESARTGCGCDTQSKGERKIKELLNKWNIYFKEQKHFKECKYINTLPFDFYIPSLDLLIEYHGKQHYEFIKFFHGTLAGFKKQQTKDKIKKEYAEANHKFLVIPYWDFDNIEAILEKEINKLK